MWRAALFDFDGLLVDTESAGLVAWREVYAAHGHELEIAQWRSHENAHAHDWASQLLRLVDAHIDLDALHAMRRRRRDELCVARPNARSTVEAAHQLGMKTALVSNSSSAWVAARIACVCALDAFDVVVTGDQGHAPKPDPAGYLLAIEALGVSAQEAVAFEDSPAGVRAATSAGLHCVAVPGELNSHLDFGHASAVATELSSALLTRDA